MDTGHSRPDVKWFQRMTDNFGLVSFVLRVRPDIAFEFVNPGRRTQLVGYQPSDSIEDAKLVLDRIEPDSAEQLARLLALPPGQETSVDLGWLHLDGQSVRSRGWVQAVERADGSVIIEGVLQDVTELHQLERELRISEQRYRLLAENAWEVVWIAGTDGKVRYCSPAVERQRGFTVDEVMRQALHEVYPPESEKSIRDYFRRLRAAIREGTEPPVLREEHEYYRRDGSRMVGEMQAIPHVDESGTVVEILGVTRDVSERKQFEAELQRRALTDSVTGVWNRRHGEELLGDELSQARESAVPLTVLMLDIDHFKAINDRDGHQAGDRVLMEVGLRLQDTVPADSVVARWGGEEFVVLLRDCPLAGALVVAEKIRARIANTAFQDHRRVTVSVGAAELTAADDLDSWLSRADQALYAAKRSGRNAVRS